MLHFSSKQTVYECLERHPIDIPLEQVLTSAGKLSILPEVAAKGYFDVDYRGDRLTFVAGRYVGLIPINGRILIDVKPKVAVRDLFHLLDIADEELGSLHFFERGYLEKKGPDENILNLLIKTLLTQLQALEREGIYKVYKRESGTGTFRSRVNFARTIQRHWSRGTFSEATFEYFQFSRDHPLNRLLKYTIWYCGSYLRLRAGATALREQLNFYFNLLETIPLDASLSFLSDVRRTLAFRQIPNLRHYYYSLARTCLFIVGNSSISLETRGEDVSLLSFILNLEELFEKYIRNVLKKNLPGTRPEIRVLDGNKDCRTYLFSDSRIFEIRPDIVVTNLGKPSLIADVKYKPKITEADRYQIITHAYSMNAQRAILVVPSFGGNPSGLIRRGLVRDRSSGTEVFEYHFRLDEDLPTEEALFCEQVFQLA